MKIFSLKCVSNVNTQYTHNATRRSVHACTYLCMSCVLFFVLCYFAIENLNKTFSLIDETTTVRENDFLNIIVIANAVSDSPHLTLTLSISVFLLTIFICGERCVFVRKSTEIQEMAITKKR